MDILKIAKKLEPLLPLHVGHWLKARDTADPDMKSLIEKQIVSTAHKLLGDFYSKPLLSLPPEKKAKGTFHLGTIVYEKEKWPVGISSTELMQNLAIYGRSGAGKTNVAFHLLEQLIANKIPFLFLDWKRTARHLIPRIKRQIDIFTPGRQLSEFPFNPFIVPPGIESSIYVNHLVDIMGDAYTLGDGSKSILQKAIANCYKNDNHSPSVADILKEVEGIPEKERVRGWKISAVRALESLAFSGLTSKDSASQIKFANSILNQNTIIELDSLSQGSKKFLIPILCFWLYQTKLGSESREKLSFMIFLEEAHHVVYRQEHRTKETMINMLLRQCREIGIGFVVIDQHPHLISSAALGNTYTSICMNQKDPADINKAAGLSLIDEEDKKYFSMLPVGQGIVKLQDRWRRPFLVKFPLIPVKKGIVTDRVLFRYLKDCKSTLDKKNFRDEFKEVRPFDYKEITLNNHDLAFIEDVIENQDDGVKIRYKRLGLSCDKGNKMKERLIEHGWLIFEFVRTGNSRKCLLRITKDARKALGIDHNKIERGSIAHEYWKRFYAKLFEEKGYRVQLEAIRRGGKVDVLATKDRERIGIEIETGKSYVVTNVRKGLSSRFDKMIIVATDEAAMLKIEKQLSISGLIIPGRIILVLRYNYEQSKNLFC